MAALDPTATAAAAAAEPAPTPPPVGDTGATIRFLSDFESGPWHLVSIVPDGRPTARTFTDEEKPAAAAWIAERRGRENLYFHVNRLKPGTRNRKAKKEDIAEAVSLHVDVDDDRALPALRAFELKPTAIVFSGGGYQAFWRLSMPTAELNLIEQLNIALRDRLGADKCQDVSRIMRLPGTINLPTEKKRQRGRTPVLAQVVDAETDWSRTYSIDELTAALLTQRGSPPANLAGTAAEVDGGGNGFDGEEHLSPGALNASHWPSPHASVDDLDLSAIDEDKAARLQCLIRYGEANGLSFRSRSEAVFYVCCELIRADVPDSIIQATLLDRDNRISDHIYAQGNPAAYAQRQLVQALRKQPRLGPILPRSDHAARARAFIAARRPNLRHWRGEYQDWRGSRYWSVDDDEITAEVATFLDRARAKAKNGRNEPFLPNRASVAETLFQVRAGAHLSSQLDPPSWLDGRALPLPTALMSFPNGLLNWRTGELMPPTPHLFTQHACGFAYDSAVPTPERWPSFLDQAFEGEHEQIDVLQEMVGYFLTPDSSLQKIFLLIGPSRSGKGTIARVIRRLLANGATCGPTIASFAGAFGLQPLLGRQLAVVDDLRLGKRTDRALITERLLTISGGGYLSVDRKYLAPWQGTLSTKFLIVSNVVPAFEDDSGALASRFVTLTRQSFYGKEDLELDTKLQAELPGILLWAVEGLRRLFARGRFAEPQQNIEMQGRLAAAASPVIAFVTECCVYGSTARIAKDALFNSYSDWAKRNEVSPMDKAHFAEALFAASGGKVTTSRPLVGRQQVPHFVGIKLVDHRREGLDIDKLPF